jgi:two-component system response regulator RegX3
VLVVDVAEEVLLGNRAARELGLIRDGVLAAFPELRQLVRQTRRTSQAQEIDLAVPQARIGRAPAVFRARVAPIGDGTIAILLEDLTEARRVEDVRRDFVANVSHELKTPVGALSLLAEALQDACDDPEAVRRFAGRAQHEAHRLGRLVQELIDLSRLQGADPMPAATTVEVDRVLAEAVDRTRTTAQARSITLTVTGDPGLTLQGNEQQLVTAVVNLLDNAVNYSGESSTVTVRACAKGDGVRVTRLLVVEDEESISEPLAYMLSREGFEVAVAASGPGALEEFSRSGADLVLLDLMLPGLSGTEVCRSLRASSSVPIIMLTARDSEVDKVVGLELGADDYVTKPFSHRELVARIRAVLRRRAEPEAPPTTELTAGPVRMDVDRHLVTVRGEPVQLPLKEFELLELLLRNAGRVLTRQQLIDRVWGSDYVGDTKTLDVHVKRLRAKIEGEPGSPVHLQTVRGLGYKFEG